MTTSSAPGKIILFGEHAVVYGYPALAVPVTQVQATATVRAWTEPFDKRRTMPGIWIDAPDIGLHSEISSLPQNDPLATVIMASVSATGGESYSSLAIHISSTIPVASGLGSGAAVSVAVIRALTGFLGQSLTDEQVCALAYEVEKLHHGTPSGIDNTVIAYSQPVYFIKGQPIAPFHVGAPFTLVIGDTGVSAPTKESVGDVRKLWEADKTRLEKVFERIGEIARSARERIENGEWDKLGPLMDANHTLLQELTVSSADLDRLVDAARTSGALGAKMSGGGRGGNMIALVQKENAPAVAEALMSAGARRTIVTQVG